MTDMKAYEQLYSRFRQLPEKTDAISAYGYDWEYDGEVLSDFYELLCGFLQHEDEKEVLAISFIQLYSWDFQNSHEGLVTFYENLYEANPKEEICITSNWLIENGHIDAGKMMQTGFDINNRRNVSEWIYDNTGKIYDAYRDIMIKFEEKYVRGK